MIGYKSARRAISVAKRKNEYGLTGPGQVCGVVELRDGSFGFWTAHNAFGGEPQGKVLLKGGKYIPGKIWFQMVNGFCDWKDFYEYWQNYRPLLKG